MKTLIDYSELMTQWNFAKNVGITPEKVTFASAKKIWWQCEKGHEWQARVFSRTKNGSGCPVCKGKKADASINLILHYPSIALEWHNEKNDIALEKVPVGSGKKYWWKCKEGHEWETSVRHRTKNNTNCPYCCNQKVDAKNSLGAVCPELIAEWHPFNKMSPFEVAPSSHKNVLWQCPKATDHIWEATVTNRYISISNCPCCSGRKVVPSNCLRTTHPQIALEWHPKNTLTPDTVTSQSNEYVWLQCIKNKDHVWRTKMYVRTKGCGCPFCSASVGELAIESLLNKLKVSHKREFKFKKCQHKRTLPFDFALLENNRVKGLIEFQGRHHFEAITYFGGEKEYNNVLIRDAIKKEYCEKNDIPFLVISHWEINNIEKLVLNFTKKHNIVTID